MPTIPNCVLIYFAPL